MVEENQRVFLLIVLHSFLSIKLQNSTTILTITVAEVSGLRSNQQGIE